RCVRATGCLSRRSETFVSIEAAAAEHWSENMSYEAFYDDLRDTRFALNHGAVEMPAVGFGTLFRDLSVTTQAVKEALDAGFRHFDCAERYRNEDSVGVAIKETLEGGKIRREDLF